MEEAEVAVGVDGAVVDVGRIVAAFEQSFVLVPVVAELAGLATRIVAAVDESFVPVVADLVLLLG